MEYSEKEMGGKGRTGTVRRQETMKHRGVYPILFGFIILKTTGIY
jgi:hypothetical protein